MVYTGVMGSGKTYEGVSTASLNALRQGRRVVTNIAGFNFSAIRDFLGPLKDGLMLSEDKVVVIPSKSITESNFFYDPDNKDSDSIVKPGDLVLIDEVWAFWGTDSKLLPEHQKFFRMHRHYTESDSGVSCDLVIMIQDLSSLHRSIRGVIESNFKFTKLKSLGLTSRYRLEIFEGNRQRRGSLVTASVKKYDKRIFPLYKSYDAGTGKESVVDARQNLLNNKYFLVVMVIAIFGFIGAGWWFVRYVNNLQNGGVPSKQINSSNGTQSKSSAGSASTSENRSQSRSQARLVALVEQPGGESLILIQFADGRFLRQRMNGGVIDGWQSTAAIDGQLVGFGGEKAK